MKTRAAIAWTLLALYAPFVAVGLYSNLFAECRCDHCRWTILKLWPVLPTMVTGTLLDRFEHPAILGAVLMIGAVAAIVLIGRRSRRWFIVCLVAEVLVSCWLAVAACALVRA